MSDIFKKSGKGWHNQFDRHSSARLTGHAGPLYSSGGKAVSVRLPRVKIVPWGRTKKETRMNIMAHLEKREEDAKEDGGKVSKNDLKELAFSEAKLDMIKELKKPTQKNLEKLFMLKNMKLKDIKGGKAKKIPEKEIEKNFDRATHGEYRNLELYREGEGRKLFKDSWKNMTKEQKERLLAANGLHKSWSETNTIEELKKRGGGMVISKLDRVFDKYLEKYKFRRINWSGGKSTYKMFNPITKSSKNGWVRKQLKLGKNVYTMKSRLPGVSSVISFDNTRIARNDRNGIRRIDKRRFLKSHGGKINLLISNGGKFSLISDRITESGGRYSMSEKAQAELTRELKSLGVASKDFVKNLVSDINKFMKMRKAEKYARDFGIDFVESSKKIIPVSVSGGKISCSPKTKK